MSSIKEAKQQATRLLTRLNELGIAIKHSQALEGVAAIFNHSDWNRYSAQLKSQENSASDVTDKSGEKNENITTLADTPLTFLAMSPGYGKSTILYHCLADALYHPSATGIYIDCSGHRPTGIPYEIPRNIACHCSLIQLRVTEDGELLRTVTESLDSSEESLKRIVIYSIDFGGFSIGRNNLANSNALFSLVYEHILKLPQAFLSELRYALIDESDRIGFKAMQRGLSSLCGRLPSTKIVVSSQTLPEVVDLDLMPSAPFSFISNTQSVNAFATRFSGLELEQMAQPYRSLSVYNADTFDQTIDLSDPNTFVKSIATFTAYNLHRKHLGKSWQDSYDLPITNNAQLAYFEDCTKEIVDKAMTRETAKRMGFAV